jgi:glucosamine--fructose-6-phosphate aminotransferase (isomerizing)
MSASGLGQVEVEIAEQPQAITRLLSEQRGSVEQIAQAIRARSPRTILIAARGSSDNAARYAQTLFGAQHKKVVALASPSLETLYDANVDVSEALVIGVSQSGQSPDIVSVVDRAQKQGALTVAITNDISSPLAAAATHCLGLSAGEERAVAATKTYTNQLMSFAMLSTALAEKGGEELALVPNFIRSALERARVNLSGLEAFSGSEQWVTLGRGYNYSTAFELALKMKEMASVFAESFSGAEFLPGPNAMVGEGVPVITVAPSGKTFGHVTGMLPELSKRKARSIVLTDDADLGKASDLWLPLPEGIPEWLSPIVAITVGQVFALELARSRGRDPDKPRGLSKVTRTL